MLNPSSAYADAASETASKTDSLPPAVIAVAGADEAHGYASPTESIAVADTSRAMQSLASALPLTPAAQEKADPLTELTRAYEREQAEKAREAERAARDTLLAYDPALIAAIGSQASTGHMICCPGFACAYGDAIVHDVANDHAAYGCGTCTWPGWGGGNSSFRSLGSDSTLLREAYDQIAAGKPTVIHVRGTSNEHWITLIGYCNVEEPDSLELANFTALDPYDGAEINAADRYTLYGDFCEHVSEQ